jgi:subtilisin-like proprotein convertase family protein
MTKIYISPHNTSRNFKKQFLWISLLLFLTLHTGTNIHAQCNNSNPSGTISAPSPGNTVQINACAFAGDYSTINNVTANTSYTVTSSIAADFFTVRQGTPGGPVIAFGPVPLTWASTIAGTYYVHINSTVNCGTQNTCRVTAITTNTCTPPVVSVSPATSCGGVLNGGPCNLLTASGANTYTWWPLTGLYLDCTHTAPYTGGNTATVYAAPTSYTVYTVTGTITGSGCNNTATARVNYSPAAPVVTPNPAIMCLGDAAVKLKVVPAQNTVQFCSGPVNIPVPDNNPAGASNNISVSGIPASCTVPRLTVSINMTHTRIGNMVFVLKAPNGQIINLDYHLGASGGNGSTTGFVNTIISSIGTVGLSTGSNPYTGTFKADAQGTPAGGFGATGPTGMQATATNWASLVPTAASANGTWTLGFYDGVTGDVGILTSWCLGINYICGLAIPGSPATWSPIAGLFSDSAATTAYVGSATDSVWARPTPAGTYTYQVTTQSLPGSPAVVSFTNPAPITINAVGTATPSPANVVVSGLPISGVTVKSVDINGFNHTWAGDVNMVLQSPNGTNVILMANSNADPLINANNVNLTFSDAAAGSLPTTSPMASGTYLPTNRNGSPFFFLAPGPVVSGPTFPASPSLTTFTGNMNGTWKLFVEDRIASNLGNITGGFTINFNAPATPCTSPPRAVVVTVGVPATISVQPANQNICLGQSATFSVTAAGPPTLNYQWQISIAGPGGPWTNLVNAGPYSGVTTNTLSITTPPVSMSGYYYKVAVSGAGACNILTSAPALLTVNLLPTIVISANPLIVLPGMPTTIHSTVLPNPAVTYTWFRNGSVVAGATADSLVVDISGLGDYQLRVTDINGCTNLSNIITITDHFASNLFVYPNPSTGQFQARYYSEPNTSLPRSLIVYDNMGNKVVTKSYTQTISFQRTDIDLRRQGKGLYWVELVDGKGKRLALSRVLIH